MFAHLGVCDDDEIVSSWTRVNFSELNSIYPAPIEGRCFWMIVEVTPLFDPEGTIVAGLAQ
eukprot:11030548-Prorocentrum_lima.AAC.1